MNRDEPAAHNRVVRVFISSTFRDMHAERDHLVTVVFPELRERCERLGLEFFDVDLRWGVPDKNVDGESANSWEYCRKWINEARPFFVCLLGQRYGWEPEPHQLKDETDRQAQAADRRSITDMEVHHALENDAHSRRCYFYLRQAEAPATATEFADPPPLLVKLDALKARVETCGCPVWHYPCRWTGSGFTGMEAFGEKVLEDLWSGILRDPRYASQEAWRQVLGTDPATDSRYTDESQPVPDDLAEKLIPLAKPPPKTPLEAQRNEMQRFADSRLKGFQGRQQEMKELLQFITDPSEAHDSPRLAVIAAQPGQGKSALMAKLSESLHHSAFDIPHFTFVVTHFVGATSQSSSSYHLVKRLNDELDASGIIFPERPLPEGQPKEESRLDFQILCQRLWDRLGDYAGEKRIVILLDALNQLDDGHELGWLPYRLGPSVRMVVSCINNERKKMEGKSNSGNLSAIHFSASNAEASPAQKVLAALDSRHPKPKRIPLGPLTRDDVHTIVTGYLKEYCKELDAPHVDAICDELQLPQARNPLYLLVMLAELRTLGGNEMNKIVPDLIANMATRHPDTVSLFKWVLERMEQAEGFGKEAVQAWCLYLALGRVGMASRELADLLKHKLGDEAALTAQRIERALRRYLQRRGEQRDFFHGQLREAVMERFGAEATKLQTHEDIAVYFRELADPEMTRQWNGLNPRPFDQLAFHSIRSCSWQTTRSILEDIFFLEARINIDQLLSLVADFEDATNHLPPNDPRHHQFDALGTAIRRELDFITERFRDYPQSLFQSLWNLCWFDESNQASRPTSKSNEVTATTSHQPATTHSSLKALLDEWNLELQARFPNRKWVRLLSPHPFLKQRQLHVRLSNHVSNNSFIKHLAVSPDEQTLVVLMSDAIRVWDTKNYHKIYTVQRKIEEIGVEPDQHGEIYSGWGRFNEFQYAVFSSDSRMLALSFENQLRFLDTYSGHEYTRIMHKNGHKIYQVCFANQTNAGAYSVGNGGLHYWDKTFAARRLIGGFTGILFIKFSPDDKYLAAVSAHPGSVHPAPDHFKLYLFDVLSGDLLHSTAIHPNSRTVAFSPDAKNIVALEEDGRVRIRSVDSWQEQQVMDFPDGDPRQFAASPCGTLIAIAGSTPNPNKYSASIDAKIVIFNLQTGQVISQISHEFCVIGMKFSRDLRYLAAATHSGGFNVWSVHRSPRAAEFVLALDKAICIDFITEGAFAVTGARDGHANVWSLTTGLRLERKPAEREPITSVAFGPDGRLAADRGDRRSAYKFWEAMQDKVPDRALELMDERAAQFLRLFKLKAAKSECLIVTRSEGDLVALLPLALDNLEEHPFADVWAGTYDGHLVVFELVGGPEATPKFRAESIIYV